MMRPGFLPGAPKNKSAETRMENTKIDAKRMNLPGNLGAQQALRNQTSQVHASPVGRLELPKPQHHVPVELPTQGPAMPEPEQEFNPEVFKEDMVNHMIGQIRTEKFIQSPRVKDAMTSIQIKEFLNQANPNRPKDTRSLLDQVIDRMGMRP